MHRVSEGLPLRRWASAALLVIGAELGASPVEAQGPRAGFALAEMSPVIDVRERLAEEERLIAKLSGGQRGLLIGMAIGTVVGAGLGYLGCTAEQNEIPCAHVIPLFAAGGLGLGALMGYSIGREDR